MAFTVGQRVMVNMAGFQAGGVSMGQGAYVSGVITSISGNDHTVKLSAVLGGIDTVTVLSERLQLA